MKTVEYFIEKLKELKIDIIQGNEFDDDYTKERIVIEDMVIDDVSSSGTNYDTIYTYQIDLYTKFSKSDNFIMYKQFLNDEIGPVRIYHEFNKEDNMHHYFCSIDLK